MLIPQSLRESRRFCLFTTLFLCSLLSFISYSADAQSGSWLRLNQPKLLDYSNQSEVEQTAVRMLAEEVELRTGFSLISPVANTQAEIVLGTRASFAERTDIAKHLPATVKAGKDAFSIRLVGAETKSPRLIVMGEDPRGLLFGVGYILRKSQLERGSFTIPSSINTDSAPVVSLRGHQLGYRPKVNSYDGFTVGMWEQYIRDLAVFGTNAVELMPPFTDDAADSPMFPLPQKEMLVHMSRLLKSYGMDVWMWYPLMHGNYSDEKVAKRSLAENDSIFKSMPKLDAVFVPGGDPGRQTPEVFFKYLPRKLEILRKYHPNAEIWISPQGYSADWMNRFIKLVNQKPQWLSGVVHGPWCRMDVDSLRKIVPPNYPIRRYPDITHSIDAQYFVPDWDYAYTVTENREVINPRPLDHQKIFRSVDLKSYRGFISYSEGVNDDVNKIVWSGLGWNPNADVTEILRDYSRYFIGPRYADDFAQGLLGLERNWKGPLISNAGVYTNHRIFQKMESEAPPAVRLNWRFQLALYRSYYDAYTRSRLIYETSLEEKAMEVLRRAKETGSLQAIKRAREILEQATTDRISGDWRQRTFELAEALFQSIRMQLSVSKYFGIDTIRGANLDLIDTPLNNRLWLEDNFNRISKLSGEQERLKEIEALVDWENPGLGGFYDDLGNPSNQPHVISNQDLAKDPNSFHSSFAGLPGGYSLEMGLIEKWRTSWKTYWQTIFGLPLEMRYDNLDPNAQYLVKVVYVEDIDIKLTANDRFVVHNYLNPAFNPTPRTFEIPKEATRNGSLSLKWQIDANADGPGRGCSVAEVWLIKK